MKKFLSLATLVLLLFSLCSCLPGDEEDVITIDPTATPPATREELYSYYDQIHRGMTRADIEALFGKGEAKQDEDGQETFIMYKNEKKSAGVNIIYAFDDTVHSKILYYNKAADLVPFCTPFDESKISELEENMPVSKATEVFGGPGLEIACEYSANSPTDYSKILSWFNADGSNFQIHTNNETISQRVLSVDPSRR